MRQARLQGFLATAQGAELMPNCGANFRLPQSRAYPQVWSPGRPTASPETMGHETCTWSRLSVHMLRQKGFGAVMRGSCGIGHMGRAGIIGKGMAGLVHVKL